MYGIDRWRGRVAVVTGASSGIGVGIVKELVKHGLVVVGIARRVDRVQELAKSLSGEKGTLLAVKADVSQEKEVLDAFAWIEKNTSGVDVLVNNAGVFVYEDWLDGTSEPWKKMFEINVVGTSLCAREAVKSMKKKGAEDGIVINVSSILGHKVTGIKTAMYTASKFAITGLTEAIHKELEASGSRIRVTNLCPGLVDTDMIHNIRDTLAIPPLQPEDIGQTVVFILSLDNRVHIPDITVQQNFEYK